MRAGWQGYFDAYPDYMIHVCDLYRVGDAVIIAGRTTGSHVRLPRHQEIRDTVIWVAEVAGDCVRLGATPDTRITRASGRLAK